MLAATLTNQPADELRFKPITKQVIADAGHAPALWLLPVG
jgi:hypothetical protein